jgi:hypothetical protein
MAFTTAPLSPKEAMVDAERRPSSNFLDWLTALITDVDASPARIKSVKLTGQAAAIGTTSIPTGALAAGLYRVSYYARITRAATTSSSLTVSIGFTETAVNLTLSGAAMTANTTATVQSNVFLIRIDSSTPISYSTAYASVGGTSMQYRLDVVLEQVEA